MRKQKQTMTKVEELTKASQDAISSVRRMIQSLKTTNDKVAEERTANDERIAKIQLDNQSLDTLKRDNEKIISNFEALLS
jgi:signal transduction histidine kinase